MSEPETTNENRNLIKSLKAEKERAEKLKRDLEFNIATHKETERALRLSEKKYRTILESIQEGYFEVDLAGNLTFFNGVFHRDILGYSREEMLGLNYRQFTTKESADRMYQGFNRVYRTGKPAYIVEYEIIRKDGVPKTVEISASLIKDASGDPIGFRGIGRDITDIKRAEETLRKSEEEYKRLYDEAKRAEEVYRSLLQSSADPIVIYDMAGRVKYLSPAFSRIFGWTLEELEGNRIPFVPESEEEKTVAAIRQIVEDGKPVQGLETRRFTKDGRLVDISISASRYDDHEGRPAGMLVILRDITERKQMITELREAKEAAEAASLTKTEFLATMSHEIRTPMNAIIGMADLLKETSLTPEQQQYVQIFGSAGENLLNIIDDILDISKVEAGHLKLETVPFDIKEIVDKTCDVLAMQAHESGLELVCHIMPEVPNHLIGDHARLHQILLNLLGNAIKFTEAGEVFLEVKRQDPKDSGELENMVELLFSVADTGIGISSEKIGSIFDSFTQADSTTTRKHGGTGLGLTISKMLVELMGGRIWVESREGEGSTFYFTAKFEMQAEPRLAVKAVPVDLKGMRVLVVDDNDTNRIILREMVSGWGAKVKETSGAEEGLNELKRASELDKPYKLLLLDSLMPDIDGFQMVEKLRSELDIADMTIMMLTSDRRSRDIARCKRLGIVSYLVKPVKRRELHEAIIGAIGGARAKTKKVEASGLPVSGDLPPLHILLVEDTEDNVLLIKSYLKKTRCKLNFAEDGQVAVEKFRSGKYDLVLMDIQMPVMDGYTATRQIRDWEKRQRLNQTPILALTAYATKEEAQKSLDAGCNAHLTKPIKKAELIEAIKAYSMP